MALQYAIVSWYICATDALVSCARNKINKFAYDGRWTFEEIAQKIGITSEKNGLRLCTTKSRFNIKVPKRSSGSENCLK